MVKDPKQPTKTLKVQAGTDEINQDGEIYRVAQGPAKDEWIVDVPAHVAEHVIRQGGAIEILDVPPPPINLNLVSVRHISDLKATLGHGATVYEPDKDGKFLVPTSILAEIEPHGFVLC